MLMKYSKEQLLPKGVKNPLDVVTFVKCADKGDNHILYMVQRPGKKKQDSILINFHYKYNRDMAFNQFKQWYANEAKKANRTFIW